MTDARKLALELLVRIEKEQSYANLVLPKALANSELESNDRGLVQELVYGCLRWQLQYQAFTAHLAADKVLSVEIRYIIMLGLHQLLRLRIPAHAAIHTSVELAKSLEPKASGLVNAVLRRADREGLEALLSAVTADKSDLQQLAIRYSHPAWIISALSAALTADAKQGQLEELLEANNRTPSVNLVALPGSQAAAALLELGLEPGLSSPIGFLAEGSLDEALAIPGARVQDMGSQLAALALLESSGAAGAWLDLCAGPGGKAALMAAVLDQRGATLDCVEPVSGRLNMVRSALSDFRNVKYLKTTGQELNRPEAYEAVLLDAPCSGVGAMRRKPESRWRKQPEQLPGLSKLQGELLDAAVSSVRPGGVIAYVTCSPVLAETSGAVADALHRHKSLRLLNANEVLNKINPDLALSTSRKTAQLWPHLHGTDAMFIALLQKD